MVASSSGAGGVAGLVLDLTISEGGGLALIDASAERQRIPPFSQMHATTGTRTNSPASDTRRA
eukprot:scaffold214570_cov30-Tisochrysis_lutea.AAC.2